MTETVAQCLLLFRHAKSAWDNPQLPDEARPLSERGVEAAGVMGRTIAALNLSPDRVLVSPARRATRTWEIAASGMTNPPAAEITPGLYDFGDGSRLMEVIRANGGNSRVLMLVGHNPSIEELARRLIASGDKRLRAKLESKFPTAALAVIRFNQSAWAQLTEGSGTLIHFIRPRDVTEATSD